nr:immunoglobulin heavy chain junction region [Macaca mulatta]
CARRAVGIYGLDSW